MAQCDKPQKETPIHPRVQPDNESHQVAPEQPRPAEDECEARCRNRQGGL